MSSLINDSYLYQLRARTQTKRQVLNPLSSNTLGSAKVKSHELPQTKRIMRARNEPKSTKAPMFGYTTATSEAEDKRIWHKRWRAQLRGQLSHDATTDDFLPILQCAVSSPGTWIRMGKAGSALDSSAGKQSNSCPFRAYPHQMRSAQWSGSWQNGEANRFYSISTCCTFNL